MVTVQTVLESLEQIAPARFALGYDKIGLQVGDPAREVKTAVVSLDRSLAAVNFAAEADADLLLSHHPLIFNPLSKVVSKDHIGKTLMALIKADISFIAAHTNWDAAPEGINDTLAVALGLSKLQSFGIANPVSKLKLVFFCPSDSVSSVLNAVSEAGAGVIGLYRRCAFMHPGTGTFLADDEANPVVGTTGVVEEVPETRVEMVLDQDKRSSVENALRRTHPYEEPAFDFLQIESSVEQPVGRIGWTETPCSFKEFVAHTSRALSTTCLAWGNPDIQVDRVAVVGGAADDEWQAAQRAGAQILITGEVKQHIALEAAESGFGLVAAGHYATEHPGCKKLAEEMAKAIPDVRWLVFEPDPGQAGRPF